MKRYIAFFLFIGILIGQTYSLEVLGIKAADITQTIHDTGAIEYTTQTRGIFDLVWPSKNYYRVKYDSQSFGVKNWAKNIIQGEDKFSQYATIDSSGNLTYNKIDSLRIQRPIQNIFSLLAMVQSKKAKEIDTKWFNYEHEGVLGQARFVWADTSNAWNGIDSILCDHYRLDIVLSDSLPGINKNSDYFMNQIILEGIIKELWVSRNEPRYIITAKLKISWFPVIARIVEPKEG